MCRMLLVERFAYRQHRALTAAVTLHPLHRHGAFAAEFGEQSVVECLGFLEIVRPDRHISDHVFSSLYDQRPLGSLLKATSLSTRTSWGSPSTRSAMMLRRISSVPPAMRRPGADIQPIWKAPRAAASSPFSAPASPSSSMANAERSCSLGATTTFAIEASGPGCWPRDNAVIVR